MLRMTSSGTEAAMTALRLARAATGRERDRQVRRRLPRPLRRAARAGRLGPGDAGAALEPRRAGERRRGHGRHPMERPGGAARRPRERHAARGDHRRAAARQHGPRARRWTGSCELLRERADASGALLILDEVISGFRVARGGAQELTGVSADLDGHGQDHRRRPARRRLGGPRRADAHARAGRRRLPGRARCPATRSRWPPGWRRSSCSTSPPTCGWPPAPSGSPRGCARPRAAIPCRSRACRAC